MKKFLVKVGLIFLCIVFLFLGSNVLYYKLGKQSRMVAFEVYDAIDIAKGKNNCTTIILGDSVARQFFNPDEQQEIQEECYLATNQAIMPVGNYILLQEYLKNNPQTKKVYYIARPDSFCSEINFHYTYSYLVTPLYTETYKKYLDETTIETLENTFGRFFIEKNFAKWMLAKYPKLLEMYSDICEELQQLQRNSSNGDYDDDMVLYLKKIQVLCEEKDIELHILSAPVPEGYEYDLGELRDRMEEYDLDTYYAELEQSMCYVPEEEFVDGVHLRQEYLKNNTDMSISIVEKCVWK